MPSSIRTFFLVILLFFLAFCRAVLLTMVSVALLSSLTVHFRTFSLTFCYLAVTVSVFVLFSISSGSFTSECFLWEDGGGGGGIHLLVPISSCGFVLVSISRCFSLLSVLFRGSAHVTACGRVISHPTVNRW